MSVWRLGHQGAPCEYVPRQFCSWNNRFDDPKRQFRSLYCADQRVTCLREVLADLRPNAKAVADFARFFGAMGRGGLTVAGVVSAEWRRANVLVAADFSLQQGDLVDLDEPVVRERLGHQHAALLHRFGMRHLNVSEIRGKNRIITQTIARALFAEGCAGVCFRSNLDNQPCYALFEGRASLTAAVAPVSLIENVDELIRVCGEYGLILRPA